MERLKNGYGTVVLLLWNNLPARCVRGCGYMHPWSWQRSRYKYKTTGTIVRMPGSGRPSKITAEVKALVERQMRHDDEITAAQLHVLVRSGFAMDFLRTVLRCRTYLGWTFRGSSYCQLIRHENKQKRLGRGYIANSLDRCPESHGLCPSRLPVAKMTTVFSDSIVLRPFFYCSVTVPLPVCSLSWPFLCRFQTALLPF